MKIAICLPTGDLVHTDFALSLAALEVGGHKIAFCNIRSTNLCVARFVLVLRALEEGYDAVFFIDSDLAFPQDSLNRLINHDAPIVSASYRSRRPPFEFQGDFLNPTDWHDARGVHCMSSICIGFSLIRSEVFNKLPQPWFPILWEDGFGYRGEDHWFSVAARHAGYKLWCDMDLSREISHIGTTGYRLDNA